MNADAEPDRTVRQTTVDAAPPEQTSAAQDLSSAATLLESLAEATSLPSSRSSSRLQRFLGEQKPAEALREWFGGRQFQSAQDVLRELNRQVGILDRLLNRQLNRILHHPQFQQLEASWRGLMYLVEKVWREDDPDRPSVKVRVLNVSWSQLQRDLDRALEFDQSEIFRKVYEEEYGMAGGESFGVLVGDYMVGRHNTDLDTLDKLSQVAAAAFCPFIANAGPELFGLEDFGELERHRNYEQIFSSLDYLRWRSLRQKEDARFLALVLPRVLMRLPYMDDGRRVDGFVFREDVAGQDRNRYLWAGAAFAFAGNLIRAFARTGWLADIHGVHRDLDDAGLITDLPVHSFATDPFGIAPKSSTDVIVTDELEKHLAELGFISLCDCQDTEYSAFYSTPSLQQPQKYDQQSATTNARISSMLHSMLCVSRFAHYLKAMGRDRIGGDMDAHKLEQDLQRWIADYTTPDSDASPETRARYPLREANVQVATVPGESGAMRAVMHLLPHYEIEGINTSIRLVAMLRGSRRRG